MPLNRSLIRELLKRYPYEKAKEIYFGMEHDNKPSFKKGMATAKKEKHIIKKFPRKKKKK